MKILLDTLFDLLGVSKTDNTKTRASVNRLIELMKSANTMTMDRVLRENLFLKTVEVFLLCLIL